MRHNIRRGYFNSRPHGGRRSLVSTLCMETDISTHALTEGDASPTTTPIKPANFNSRPHGGRRSSTVPTMTESNISTHALTEGDGNGKCRSQIFYYFNSRPHGGRQHQRQGISSCTHFNSRPHGGRLLGCFGEWKNFGISTHALTEGDRWSKFQGPKGDISTHALTEGDEATDQRREA